MKFKFTANNRMFTSFNEETGRQIFKEAIMNTRKYAIKKMYQPKAVEADIHILDSGEMIDNWYIVGFNSIEDLEALFSIEDLYDFDCIDAKLYIKNIYN